MISSIISAEVRPELNTTDNALTANPHGVTFVSLTGPTCHIDEIDDFTTTTVALLKDAIQHCLDLPDWFSHSHIQLYLKGNMLTNDSVCLEGVGICQGSKLRYVLMVA